MRVWWRWHLELEGNWLPMVLCVSFMRRALLITSIGDHSNGSYLRSPQDLFLGFVFNLSGFFTHIRFFGPDPSIKVRSIGPLVLSSSSSSPPPPPTITISLLLKELIILLREAKNNFIEQKLLKLVLRVY